MARSVGFARRLVLGIGLVALVVPATASAASPNNWTATESLEYGNQSCGGHIQGAPLLGSVEYTRSGGQINLVVEVGGEGADPNQDYILSLWNADGCTQIGGNIATLVTDGSGETSGTFNGIKLKGAKTVFATLYNPTLGFYNNTIAVP